jgi:hypothetical protein
LNLFLAQTAYHALMALGLAGQLRRAGQGPSRLLCVEDFHDAAGFYAALAAWRGTTFEAQVALGSYARGEGRAGKVASVRRMIAAAQAEIRRQPVRALYVFNDRVPFAQSALEDTALAHPAARRLCVEDGSAAYSDARYRNEWWRAVLHRWRYGRAWRNVRVLGTHPLAQGFVAHFPEALRPELARRPHQRYPTQILGELDLAGFARGFAQRRGVDPAPWQDSDVVIAVPGQYVNRFNPDYPQRLGALLGELTRAGLRVAIKRHPRDPGPESAGVTRPDGVIEIPRALPMEFAYLLLDRRPRLAVGDISSAFLLAQRFNPGLRPVFFRHGPGFHDYSLGARLGRLQIDAVDSAAQLVALARDRRGAAALS